MAFRLGMEDDDDSVHRHFKLAGISKFFGLVLEHHGMEVNFQDCFPYHFKSLKQMSFSSDICSMNKQNQPCLKLFKEPDDTPVLGFLFLHLMCALEYEKHVENEKSELIPYITAIVEDFFTKKGMLLGAMLCGLSDDPVRKTACWYLHIDSGCLSSLGDSPFFLSLAEC